MNSTFEFGWFSETTHLRLGCKIIRFWEDEWFGTVAFQHLYPDLFNVVLDKFVSVPNAWLWMEGVWRWDWAWGDALFGENRASLEDMQLILLIVSPISESSNSWAWSTDLKPDFSVKSAYAFALNHFFAPSVVYQAAICFKKLWLATIPSKVSIFIWRAFYDRLPTRHLLSRHGIISGDHNSSYVFCFLAEESSCHLFFHCTFAENVWRSISSWVGLFGFCMSLFFIISYQMVLT